ncbi:MAG: hypothetical protein JJT78_16605 [Leptospira sp.]|nr:hypothetical protein [Leptospira sp.]
MNLAEAICLTGAGVFFMTGLITGIWKYYKMIESPTAQAPYYVDTAHRASFLYGFAGILLYVLAGHSVFSEYVNTIAAISALTFFGLAIIIYLIHGFLGDTDNQFKKPFQMGSWKMPGFMFHGFMLFLIIAEIGGSGVLILGTLIKIWG